MKDILKEGFTVFLSSHLLNEVQQVCTHVTIINKGVALASGTLKEISARISGPVIIEAEVDNISKAVAEKVKELPFVAGVSEDGKRLSIEVKSRDDVRSQISQAITAGGGIVISMSLKGESLEDVFMVLLAKGKEGRL
jgi:ABC-2 type transport system ATP-binding protein